MSTERRGLPSAAVALALTGGGEVVAEPPPPPSLDELKRAALATAAQAYAAELGRGVAFAGRTFQIDERSQVDIIAMGALAGEALGGRVPWPADFEFIAADNSRMPMDAATMLAFAATAAERVRKLRMHLRNVKDAIIEAPDAAALSAIDIAAGWPPVTA